MRDLNAALAGAQSSVNDLVAAAEQCRDTWHTPRAPGKWSPSQIVEHVALSLEEAAKVAAGEPSKFPKLPAFVRPLLRKFFFSRVLKTGAFPKGKTTKAFNPPRGAETPAEARRRLESALVRFEEACRRRAASGQKVESTVFGAVAAEDFARFQEVHTRHHCKQMPV
jgi:hypothetical protein